MLRSILLCALGIILIGCAGAPAAAPSPIAPTSDLHSVETRVAANVFATQTASAIAVASPTTALPSPTSALAATALPTRTSTPNLPTATATRATTPLPLKGWTGVPVGTVCLSINRAYTDSFLKASPNSKPTAIDDEIRTYLTGLGITAVAPGRACDANLTIEQTIDPLSAQYTTTTGAVDTRNCYSGVAVKSTATLRAQGAQLVSAKSQSRPNEKQITGCPLVSRDLGESYFTAAMAFREFWGDEILGVALSSNQIDMITYVLVELGDLGANGMRFVPAIIDFMNRPGPDSNRQVAATTLSKITGLQYGTDVKAWQLWWTQRQPTPTVSSALARTATPASTRAPGAGVDVGAMPSNLPLVLADHFTDNANDWSTGDHSYSDSQRDFTIANGVMRWTLKTGGAIFNYDIPRKMTSVRDFSAQVQAQHLKGSLNSTYGLIFRRADSSNNYTFEIQDDQTFQVTAYVKGHFDWLVRATKSTAINPGQKNLLQVIGAGSHFEFYVNGTRVAQLDNNGIEQGSIGLVTNVAANDSSIYEFSNFQVNGR